MRRFKRIYVEITNVCNLECGFCPKTARKPEFMGVDLFRRILGEVKKYSGYLYFHVMGEPLMHPEIDVFLDLCHENGFRVNITTNGTLIKKVMDKLLYKPALRQMNFSLHIFDESADEKVIDGYLDDIFAFIGLAAGDPGFTACLRLWNAREKYDSAGCSARTDGKNRYILEKIEKFFALPYEIREIPLTGNGVKIAENVYVSRAVRFDWPDIDLPDAGNNGFCLGLRNQAAILADGTVVPCCLDSEGMINLGNIKDSSFSEIINSERAMGIYNGFSERKIVEPLCGKCGYRKRFDR
ncbi:MAG: radical SAM/SPASM domain-containing protein [Candidatus Omnitrophota bacterium]